MFLSALFLLEQIVFAPKVFLWRVDLWTHHCPLRIHYSSTEMMIVAGMFCAKLYFISTGKKIILEVESVIM